MVKLTELIRQEFNETTAITDNKIKTVKKCLEILIKHLTDVAAEALGGRGAAELWGPDIKELMSKSFLLPV